MRERALSVSKILRRVLCVAGLALTFNGYGESLKIDYEASRVEIQAEALGFIPATFWFSEFAAEIELDKSKGELAAADFRFSYQKLTSGRDGRDRKIRAWLEAERFPEGRFVVDRFAQRDGEAVAIGRLRLHGVARQAEFVYSLHEDGEGVRLVAEAIIDYREWGLPPLKVLFFNVGPNLKVRIDVRAFRIEPDAI